MLFAFTHTKAIYTNALDCGRPSSFYKWAGERGYFPKPFIVELNFIVYHIILENRRGNSCVQDRDKDIRSNNRN